MKEVKAFSFHTPTRIEYGEGGLGKLLQEVEGFGSKRPLVVTDKGVIKAGILEKIERQLNEGGFKFEVYSEVQPNPSDTLVEEAAELAKKLEVDLIIGVGGGSSMDTAKTMAMLIANGGRVHEYFGLGKVKKEALPVITVPTTAGTGSEVTIWAVLTDTRGRARTKVSLGSALMSPRVALVDPLLTVSLPPAITAGTGMDALTHAIEAYTATISQPITDSLCLYAIELIGESLVPAVMDGENIKARDHMMLGSLLAGIGISNSDVGVAHFLSEAIGGLYNVPHGVATAVFLPYGIDHNLMACPDKYIDIARAMGEDVEGLSKVEAARRSINAAANISKIVGIPSLKEIGVRKQDFDKICEIASRNVSINSNARRMTFEGFKKILEDAWKEVLIG